MNKLVKPALSVALAVTMGLSSMQVFAADNLNSKYFSDVNAESFGWAASYIDSIAAKGIASGVGNNKFAPGDYIKRGDFAIFLDKTFQFDKASGDIINLVDVFPDKYYYQSIINAKSAKAITDVYNYYPENYIKRIDAINMIYNALTVQNLVGNKASTGVSMYSDHTDLLNVTDTLAVGTLTNIGIIAGSNDGMLHPNDNLTRAEMAVIFAKTSDYADQTKAEQKKAKEDKKQQEIEDSKATTDETDEKTVINSGNVNESIVIDTGKDFKAHDINLDIASQSQEAIKITNGSKVSLEDSTIKSNGYTGILLAENSSLDADNITVRATAASGLITEGGTTLNAKKLNVTSDNEKAVIFNSASADIENLIVNATEGTALDISGGANINIDGGSITGTSKQNNLINIESDVDNSTNATSLNLSNVSISNPSGTLFKIKDTAIDILLDNCQVDISKFIDNNYTKTFTQEVGCDATITLKNSEVTGDIYADHESTITLDIQEGGSFKGFIDPYMYSQNINLKIAMNGKLELMGDIYVNELHIEDFNFNNIIDNGFNIYYNDANPANAELYSDTYDMAYSGKILPM